MPADIARHLEGRTLILLSNREPYEHVHGSSGITVKRPAGGLVSALDPTMQRTHGIWVAWGSGNADRRTADERGTLMVPPEDPSYTLRRVWLDESDVDGYYLGFANSSLWPLCHMLIQHFEYHPEHWRSYQEVNERFADAVAEEAGRARERPLVWIQDYHFALAAGMLRDREPSLFIHQFWHIPFPPPDILQLLPVGVPERLLHGMLGNDLLEFHTERHALNFLRCVGHFLPDALVDEESMRVVAGSHVANVGAFPISIDVERYEGLATTPEAERRVRDIRDQYAVGHALGASVDRIDYTKGIPERLRALDVMWTESPELRECFTLVLVATPSRSDLASYKSLEDEVIASVREINERWGTPAWTPLVLIHDHVDAELLAVIYRAADLCLVSSLQDGMNLVAKEFIACQVDERGVLVLSRFTGAAEEIEGAVLINPFDAHGFADGIRAAIAMDDDERRQRMSRMRRQLKAATIFDWLDAILSRCGELSAERDAREGERSSGSPRARDARAHEDRGRELDARA